MMHQRVNNMFDGRSESRYSIREDAGFKKEELSTFEIPTSVVQEQITRESDRSDYSQLISSYNPLSSPSPLRSERLEDLRVFFIFFLNL